MYRLKVWIKELNMQNKSQNRENQIAPDSKEKLEKHGVDTTQDKRKLDPQVKDREKSNDQENVSNKTDNRQDNQKRY